jgi:hypothetical protein
MVMAVYNHVYPGTALVGGGGEGEGLYGLQFCMVE